MYFTMKVLAIVFLIIGVCHAQYGFLKATSSAYNVKTTVCVAYNDYFKQLNTTNGGPYSFETVYPDLACNLPASSSMGGGFVFVRRGECTFAEKARAFPEANGVVVVSSNDDDADLPIPSANQTDYDELNSFVMVITNASYQRLISFNKTTHGDVSLYLIPEEVALFDYSSVLLLIVATLITCLGAQLQRMCVMEQKKSESPQPSGCANNDHNSERNVNQITTAHVFLYVVFSSVTLVLLYFFYDYLVYVTIFMFYLASTVSVIFVLTTFTPLGRHSMPVVKCCGRQVSVCSIVIVVMSLAISTTWVICRHASWSWSIQNVLGGCLCMCAISMVRLPNLKVSSILLTLFFLYDIFYVFITPYLTSNQDSIMVSVATGSSNEQIPGMFKLPKLHPSECVPPRPAMLGYGDVVLPGVHVAFCAVWDAKLHTRIYFVTSAVAYTIGLCLTYVALYMMQMGQPALLYIVPCLLLTTIMVAWKRGELGSMMRGQHHRHHHQLDQNSVSINNTGGTEQDKFLP